MTLDNALAAITTDGYTVGTISTNPAGQTYNGMWIVHAQVPLPGEHPAGGSPIRLTVEDPATPCP
jgi:hypothetical protein